MSQTYDISLTISYDYESPAGANYTLLRMLPRNLPEQQLLHGAITTDPAPTWRLDDLDFFGNPTTECAHDMRLPAIDFRFRGRVMRHAPPSGLDFSPEWTGLQQEVAALLSIAPDSPHHFLGESPRLRREPEIAAFARNSVQAGMSALAAVDAVSNALHGYFDFDPTATEVTTSPIEAFRARSGVCQDISHVMIVALRSLGIPAGYVSGFLRTLPPEGQPRLEGADAMHAWVRAWCGTKTGWVELDPTNAMRAGTDHITVAFGRDYSDVAPVRGSMRAQGSHGTEHKVDVVPV